MKNKYRNNTIKASLVALSLSAGTAFAGEVMAPAPMAPEPAEDFITGSLSLAANSHFISYGLDVWRDGDSMSDLGFNPSLEFTFDFQNNLTMTFGTWWDVNSKGAPSIGGNIQEIDVWAGIGYSIDKFSISTTYQAWNYAKQTEQILDVTLAYDTFLSPSLTFHNRLDIGSNQTTFTGQQAKGTVMVLGLSHDLELGPVTVSFPVNFATLLGENYYGPGLDSGYAYTSVGMQASYPLAFMGSDYGDWSFDAGITQFWTNANINNVDSNNFATYNFGISASF